MKYLFVGGSQDGKRLEISDTDSIAIFASDVVGISDSYHKVNVVPENDADNNGLFIYRLQSINDSQLLYKLVTGYKRYLHD